MAYKNSKLDPEVDDVVVGDQVKGRVVRRLPDGKAVVRSAGPYDGQRKRMTEVDAPYDPATLTLIRRP